MVLDSGASEAIPARSGHRGNQVEHSRGWDEVSHETVGVERLCMCRASEFSGCDSERGACSLRSTLAATLIGNCQRSGRCGG